MTGTNGIINIGELVITIILALLLVIGVEELSRRISKYLQHYIRSNGLFGERLDNGLSMILLGVLLLVIILGAGLDIKLNSLTDPHFPTIGAIGGGVSILLGTSETVYLITYKIPKFKSQYDTDL